MTTTLAPRIETAERRRRILVAVHHAWDTGQVLTVRELAAVAGYGPVSQSAGLREIRKLVEQGWLKAESVRKDGDLERSVYTRGPLFGGLLRNKETGVETPLRLIE